MRYKMLYIALAAFMVSLSYSATPPIAAPYSAFTNWLPIIMVGVLLAWSLAGVYYMIGYLLNNNRIKASAISELEQAAGTVVLVIIIIGVLLIVGTSFSAISFASLIGSTGQSQISNICTNYLTHSQVAMLNSNYYDANAGNLPEPTTAVCNLINGGAGVGKITSNIDYGLAATYVVIANMTNQSVVELNGIYNFESLTFFLRNVNAIIGECFPVSCADPLTPRLESIYISYKPFAGYVLHRTILPSITTQGNLTFYMLTMQLVVLIFTLMFWPWLLAAGIILRTIPFTRRAGGLILAGTIAFVLILPTIFLIEYSSLNNLGADPFIGASQLPGLALCAYGNVAGSGGNNVLYCYTAQKTLKTSYIYKDIEPSGFPATISSCGSLAEAETAQDGTPLTDPIGQVPSCYVQKNINLYVFPVASDIVSLYACYPTGSTIIPTEVQILTYTVVQSGVLPISVLLSLFVSNSNLQSNPISGLLGNFFAPGGTSCLSKLGPHDIVAATDALVNMYGLITVASFLIPIINLLMLLSAITGLSSVVGGDTTIIGLSRFL